MSSIKRIMLLRCEESNLGGDLTTYGHADRSIPAAESMRDRRGWRASRAPWRLRFQRRWV